MDVWFTGYFHVFSRREIHRDIKRFLKAVDSKPNTQPYTSTSERPPSTGSGTDSRHPFSGIRAIYAWKPISYRKPLLPSRQISLEPTSISMSARKPDQTASQLAWVREWLKGHPPYLENVWGRRTWLVSAGGVRGWYGLGYRY